MSGPDSEHDKPEKDPVARDDDDEIDEELTALSGPPPSLRHAVIICVILCLSAAMLYWFVPDLSYLLQGLEEPQDLGEAADIRLERLEVNRHVAIHGLPMMHRSVEFKEGIKWFAQSDTMRKLFPLTGQSRLFVQWTEPEERKAYRDPAVNPERLALPYDFTGHLVDKTFVGRNYEKIWVFYDCVELHSTRQCRHCLGLSDMDICRARFTCLENFPVDECQVLLDSEEHQPTDDSRKLERLVAETRSEEIGRRINALAERIAERRKQLDQLRDDVKAIESGEMKSRLQGEVTDLQRRSAKAAEERRQLEARVAELGLQSEKIRPAVAHLKQQVALATSEVRSLTRRATILKEDLDLLEPLAGSALDEASNTIVTRIREELAQLERDSKLDGDGGVAQARAGTPSADGGMAADAGTEAPPGDDIQAQRIAELRSDLESLEAGTLVDRRSEQIQELRTRLAAVDERKNALDLELKDKKRLARRLASLPRESRERDEKLAELRDEQKKLESGAMKEEMLATIAQLSPGLERMERHQPRVNDLLSRVKSLTPDAHSKQIAAIEEELAELEEAIGPATWILIDDETPGDKIWVVAVYVIFLLMIGINVRRLYRFWIAWRS